MKMELRARAIDKVYKRRDRIDMPDFQREEVWSANKKQLLIDSILKGWHLPKFYFRKLDDGTFECVDGQQRLKAIYDFYDDQITLPEETASLYGGAIYSTLPDEISDKFDDYEIDVEEIEDATDRELEDLFLRLQLGTSLNTAEKLNAIGGGLRDFCHNASSKPFFAKKISLRNARYAHFEIIARWLFIETRGIQPQIRFPQLVSFLKENRTFSPSSETGKKISRTLDYLNSAFPEKTSALRNRANLLSVCMLASQVIAQGLDKSTAKIFGKFAEDFFSALGTEVEKGVKSTEKEILRYQQAISVGSADGPSIRERINILTKRLAIYSSEFAPLLGAYDDASREATKSISELANVARDMIYNINRKYSGTYGQDLFKMTNESVASLQKIAHSVSESQAFGEFIDALYFLVYEGSGSCKRLPSPPPEFVMEVKFLRTLLRHDVDHGDETEIKKKKMRNTNVFEKYSGKKTPGECSSEDFLATQIRILDALKLFLNQLLH